MKNHSNCRIFWISFLTIPLLSSLNIMAHPLNGLSETEYSTTNEILRKSGVTSEETLFQIIELEEPAKELVLKPDQWDSLDRRAKAIFRNGRKVYEAIVNISENKVDSFAEKIIDAQLAITDTDWERSQTALRDNPDFMAGLKKRGITNFDDILCDVYAVGYFGGDESRRLGKATCFLVGTSTNSFARPIEGLYAVIDIDLPQVIEVEDGLVTHIPDASNNLDERSQEKLRPALKPIVVNQPQGTNYKIEDHLIKWQNWEFHYRFNKRVGLILSLVKYVDQQQARQVLYQGFLSEMLVPYMDPSSGWYDRAFFDAGDYHIGGLSFPLQKGMDCPQDASYLSVVLSNDDGSASVSEDVICVFETALTKPIWRHYDENSEVTQGRPSVELTIRSIATISNYDYILDWVFTQDGSIKIAVGSTGIIAPQATEATRLTDSNADTDRRFGELVAPNIIGVNHDHYFVFRLDVDVDGPSNSFSVDRLVSQQQGKRSYWQLQRNLIPSESAAKLNMNLQNPAMWRVFNPSTEGALGHNPGYVLNLSGGAVMTTLYPEDFVRKRAGFIDYNLWVTQFSPQEKYAAGEFTNQSRGGDGLPIWTQQNRNLVEKDLVLWPTIGMHHAPRIEDWPVMPTVWKSIELRPYNFFDKNPALGLREAFQGPTLESTSSDLITEIDNTE